MGRISTIYISFSKWTNHESILFYYIILRLMLLEAIVLGDNGNHVPQPILKAIGNWESSLIYKYFPCRFRENHIYLSSLSLYNTICMLKSQSFSPSLFTSVKSLLLKSVSLPCSVSTLWCMELDWAQIRSEIPQVLGV